LAQRFQNIFRVDSSEAFGVAEVEKPQPGGAGCGYTFLFEAIVSSALVIEIRRLSQTLLQRLAFLDLISSHR
jgi:hypothetical protein